MESLPIDSSGLRQDSETVRFLSSSWVAVLTLCCLIAVGLSGYLTWVAMTSSKVAGCGGGKLFNCGHVISSRWSLWMGLPVSLLAFGSYLCMGAGLLVGSWTPFAPQVRYAGWVIVTMCALTAGLAAIWFTSLQLFVIGRLCSHCLAVHACGLVVAGVALGKPSVGAKSMKWISALSATGIGLLIGGQLIAKPPTAYQIESFETPATESEVFEFSAPTPTDDPINDQGSFSPPTTRDSTFPGSILLGHRDLIDSTMALAALRGFELFLATTQITQTGQLAQADSSPDTRPAAAEPKEGTKTAETSGVSKPPAKRRFISISGGSVKLDVAQWPIVGPQGAIYIFVEMFDYSCPHCRKTHVAIKGATKQLDGQLAVVTLPVPLNAKCNSTVRVTHAQFLESCELAKLAVSVWRVDAKKFAEFHDWMFSGDQAPTFKNAYAHAATVVRADKLAAEFGSTVPGQYVSKNVELYKRVGSGNVPKLMFPRTSVVGEFTSPNALADLIRREAR